MRAIFYDTETTGLSPDSDLIIEIAAFDPVKDRVFHELINPGKPIPKQATSIHNITDEMVSACPNFGQIARKFEEFCEGDVVLIAHNNDAFDKQFLSAEFSRHQIKMPEWKFIDSLKWARRYRPDLPRHGLQFLREIYGIPANNAHRALDDVKVLHQIFASMIDNLTISDAYTLIQQVRAKNDPNSMVMPFGKYQGTPLQQIPSSYIQWLKTVGTFEKPENKDLKTKFEKLGLIN